MQIVAQSLFATECHTSIASLLAVKKMEEILILLHNLMRNVEKQMMIEKGLTECVR